MDNFINALQNPDTWALIFTFLYAVGIGAAKFVLKKMGVQLKVSFKKPLDIEGKAKEVPKELVANAIETELAALKESHRFLQGLFDLSRDQWADNYREIEKENQLLRTVLERIDARIADKPKEKEKEKEKE